MKIRDFQDLDVWQKAMDLMSEVYRLVKKLPEEERYELSSQMRRAAISVPSNISEGQQRASTKEFVNFLSIARGSTGELQTQLLACVKLQYMCDNDIHKALALSYDVGRMLNSLISRLKAKS